MRRSAVTYPLPSSFPADEIGLMTKDEYLKFINPKNTHHQRGYDFSLDQMNRALIPRGFAEREGSEYVYSAPYGGGTGLAIERDGRIVAIIVGSTAYLAHPLNLRHLRSFPTPWPTESRINDQLDGVERAVLVKYPVDHLSKISDVVKRNRAEYDRLVQRLNFKGEPLELRSKGAVERNTGTSLAILNQRGEVIAVAQSEWGTTLVVVARPYRKQGLGPLIHKYWQEFNPTFESGGVTVQGQALVLQRWEERVREFLERGWYGGLVRGHRLPLPRAKAILHGLAGRHAPSPLPTVRPKLPARAPILIYVNDPTFVVYDARFLQEQDEDYILGYGFFRDANPVGSFLFRIDYEPKYRKLLTMVALQMARDAGDRVYVGESYGDLVEPQGIPGVRREGDYLTLDRDVLDLRTLSRRERTARARVDQYDQIHTLLLEQAESKWS